VGVNVAVHVGTEVNDGSGVAVHFGVPVSQRVRVGSPTRVGVCVGVPVVSEVVQGTGVTEQAGTCSSALGT
jgi:hypothetical protein